jgi:hypothetical protein
MSEKMTPKEPEQVSCEVCLKEIPVDEAKSAEATDYVAHFCGLECFEKWKQKEQPQEKGN